jgi:hypothetical protein
MAVNVERLSKGPREGLLVDQAEPGDPADGWSADGGMGSDHRGADQLSPFRDLRITTWRCAKGDRLSTIDHALREIT